MPISNEEIGDAIASGDFRRHTVSIEMVRQPDGIWLAEGAIVNRCSTDATGAAPEVALANVLQELANAVLGDYLRSKK